MLKQTFFLCVQTILYCIVLHWEAVHNAVLRVYSILFFHWAGMYMPICYNDADDLCSLSVAWSGIPFSLQSADLCWCPLFSLQTQFSLLPICIASFIPAEMLAVRYGEQPIPLVPQGFESQTSRCILFLN